MWLLKMWLFSAFHSFIKKCQEHFYINFFGGPYPNYFLKIIFRREISGRGNGEYIQHLPYMVKYFKDSPFPLR